MKLKINMDVGNEAFDDNKEAEVARILRDLAAKVERTWLRSGNGGVLLDINGNKVGTWEATE